MTKAERQRRWRQRRARGVRRLSVDVEADEFTVALIEAGRLTEDEALDPVEVGKAASDVLSEWSHRWLVDAARR
jgi:hypothetical protein